MKTKRTRILFIILVILVVILAGLEAKSMLDSSAKKITTVVKTKKIGPYTINVDQTEYQKELEPELKAALDSKKSREITDKMNKYFISDYFTLRNKPNIDSVGGLGFVLPKTQGRFKTNAIESYYMDITDYIKDYGAENLPLVTSVEVGAPKKVNPATVNFPQNVKNDIKAVYDMDATWTYESNEKLDPKAINLVDKITIRVVKVTDNTWWIYELIGE